MLWWQLTHIRLKHLKRPLQRRQSSSFGQASIENLEARLPLGSIPTPTGTLAGELLPVEAINDLTPVQTKDQPAVEIALPEGQRVNQVNVDAAFEDIERIQNEAESAAAKQAKKLVEDEAVRQAHAPQQTGQPADEPSNTIQVKKPAKPRAIEINLDDSEALGDEQLGDALAEDAAAEAEATDGEKATNPSSTDLAKERLAASSSESNPYQPRDNGPSAGLSHAIDITFAATGSPSETPKPTSAAGPVFASGGNSNDELAAEAWMQALEHAYFNGTSSSSANASAPTGEAWFSQASQPVVVRYDFRDVDGIANQMTTAEKSAAESALQAWTDATNGQLRFVRDTAASDDQVITIGKGDLTAMGYESADGGTLAIGGGLAISDPTGNASSVTGLVWLDQADTWDTAIGNTGDNQGYDVFTVVAHEIGHSLGGEDAYNTGSGDIMNGTYDTERSAAAIRYSAENYEFAALSPSDAAQVETYELHAMLTGAPQLTAAEVRALLNFATAVTPSRDAIIAIVDRAGNILGVRMEDGLAPGIQGNPELRTFAIDGAVAKARTAAFFANNGVDFRGTGAGTPLTSRTIRNISQSTVTYREVASNPNSTNQFIRGPGFVAPIGVGGHFPPAVANTPPVDLFAIEHTNRDSLVHPGLDGNRRTAGDNIILPSRFNVPLSNLIKDMDGDDVLEVNAMGVPEGTVTMAVDTPMNAPESYGTVSGVFPAAQSRGIATLPGGVPLYRDTNGNGVGDTLIGGVGVFFPGVAGTADFEQNFIPGIGQTEFQRTNAPKVLEAEFIAVATAGGSITAQNMGAAGADITVNPVPTLDIPFGRLDLVGISLEVAGPIPGILGVQQLLQFGRGLGAGVANSRLTANPAVLPTDPANEIVTTGGARSIDGKGVASGWLVAPHNGGDFDGVPGPDITTADVMRIVQQGITEANLDRAAIRLPLGQRTQMVFAVADKNGDVLGLFRQSDATIFSIDVAVAKARNTAYYADSAAIQTEDRVRAASSQAASLLPAGAAFTNRTFRFLAEPRFPSGIDGAAAGPFSQLKDIGRVIGVTPVGQANKVAIVESTAFIKVGEFNKKGLPLAPNQLFDPNTSVLGHDAFFPASNFRDPGNIANQNGIVFFPGSTSVYKGGRLVGGFGVSGDGVDQDDVVTFSGAQGFMPPSAVRTADQLFVDGVRLPNFKFLRNPRG